MPAMVSRTGETFYDQTLFSEMLYKIAHISGIVPPRRFVNVGVLGGTIICEDESPCGEQEVSGV